MEYRHHEITPLIAAWQSGDKNAEDQLFETLYERLHRLALNCLRSEPNCQSMGATALVHEAYLRFMRSEHLEINGTGHFMSLCARVMRRVLVDRARSRRSLKREVLLVTVDEVESLVRTDQDADQILSVDRALEDLNHHSPRQARIIELRFFGGYSLEQCAAVLNISERTAQREWQVARTRMQIAISGAAPAG